MKLESSIDLLSLAYLAACTVRLPQESVLGDHSGYVQETTDEPGAATSSAEQAETGVDGSSSSNGIPSLNLPHHASPPTVRIPVDHPPDPRHGLGRAASVLDAELADEVLEEETRRTLSRSRSRSVSAERGRMPEPILTLANLNLSPPSTAASPPKHLHAPTTIDEVRAAPLSPIKRNPSISMVPSVFGDVEDRPIPSRSDPSRISMSIPGLASKESLAGLMGLDVDTDDQGYDQDL